MQLHRVKFELRFINPGDNTAYFCTFVWLLDENLPRPSDLHSSHWHSQALDNQNDDGRIKISDHLCTFDINLVRLRLNTTELFTAGVDWHSG